MEEERSEKNYIDLQGSKSILNRLMIIASMCETPLVLSKYSNCNDVLTMQNALEKMGYEFRQIDRSMQIKKKKNIKNAEIKVEDSATAFRFLLTRLSGCKDCTATISASNQLKARPHKNLVDILKKMNAQIDLQNDEYKINGVELKGGEISIDASISSQYISALLLLAPLYKNDLILHCKGNSVSSGYINMTISIMKLAGVDVKIKSNIFFVQAGQKYNIDHEFNVEPDYSSACYFWAFGTFSNNYIYTAYHNSSLQPDAYFLKLLKKMGAVIKCDDEKVGVKKGELSGIEIDMSGMPDQVPTLAVLALTAKSPTKIHNIDHLRYKESNRLQALICELKKLDEKIEYQQNALIIHSVKRPAKNIILNTYNDHRLVMSFAVIQKKWPEITLDNCDAIKKSNPHFFQQLNLLT